MSETVSKIYILFLFVGALGMLFGLRQFCLKATAASKEWSAKGIFNLTMLAALLTPVLLFISYAYNNDNQAQGRYIMCAVYPIMYFVTCGYDALLKKLVKSEAIRRRFYRLSAAVWILGAVLTYILLIIPAYK